MLTVWLGVFFFFRLTAILIQTSATILSSLCPELVTCTSFVREYAKDWFHKFLVSSVLKVLRVLPVIWMPSPPPPRAMFFRVSKSVVIITVIGIMGCKWRSWEEWFFCYMFKGLISKVIVASFWLIWTHTILTGSLVCIIREGWRDKRLFSLAEYK